MGLSELSEFLEGLDLRDESAAFYQETNLTLGRKWAVSGVQYRESRI